MIGMPRIGIGFDTHRFTDDATRRLVLAGVHVPGSMGLAGHSDADVVSHAITDALLGAACLGDMGTHFPDTDPALANADSLAMLQHAVVLVSAEGLRVGNVDCTIVTEVPKIAPIRSAMQRNLENVLSAPVSVKASRAEGMGAIGRVEGIACWATALLVANRSAGRTES